MSDETTSQATASQSPVSLLTGDAVETAFKDCLLDDVGHEGAVIPEGIVHRFAFDPERLEVHRPEVEGWIAQLPSEFLASGGGGWSFLNLCDRADGEQWTGLHLRMEQLVAMAEGLGLATFLMPRDMWAVLPGGMPYVVFRDGDPVPQGDRNSGRQPEGSAGD